LAEVHASNDSGVSNSVIFTDTVSITEILSRMGAVSQLPSCCRCDRPTHVMSDSEPNRHFHSTLGWKSDTFTISDQSSHGSSGLHFPGHWLCVSCYFQSPEHYAAGGECTSESHPQSPMQMPVLLTVSLGLDGFFPNDTWYLLWFGSQMVRLLSLLVWFWQLPVLLCVSCTLHLVRWPPSQRTSLASNWWSVEPIQERKHKAPCPLNNSSTTE